MRARTVNEEINFERGLDPKAAMGIGDRMPFEDFIEEVAILLEDDYDKEYVDTMFMDSVLAPMERDFMKCKTEDLDELAYTWYYKMRR